MFTHNTMIGMLTVKLNESLDSHPIVEYYINGEHIGESFESPFTHLQTFHHCMRVIQSTCECHACPKIAFVGTHKDLEHECPHENREMKNEKLRSIIPQEMMDNIIVCGESLLFAINAKTPGKEDHKVMSILREQMMKELHKLKPVKIPLRYFPLEMAFQRMAKDQGKSVLSKEECFQEAAVYNFTQESFEAALIYLHGLKLIFYYKDILPDVVFIDAQALLDKVTELVVHSLSLQAKSTENIMTPRTLGSLEKFKKRGIVTLEILSQFKSHYVPNLFMEKELIKIFKHLGIMAEVNEGEYLMTCLLKTEDIPCPVSESASSEVVSPLLFYFGEDGPKVGVYCFLLACLITESNWKLLSENRCPVQISRNRVQFELPRGNPGCVTITDSFSTFFHVAIEPPEGVNTKFIRSVRKCVQSYVRQSSQGYERLHKN